MDPDLFGQLEQDPALAVFAPEHPVEAMFYRGLRCPCGGVAFELSGWLWITSGRGGFFWRTLTRVWREARQSTQTGGLLESPFKLPVFARCSSCLEETAIFDDASLLGQLAEGDRQDPRESIRCRVCLRRRFELVAGVASDEERKSPASVELVSRCQTCHRRQRIAWSKSRVSDQEIQLDVLYGRR